jgi:hypothetical protein
MRRVRARGRGERTAAGAAPLQQRAPASLRNVLAAAAVAAALLLAGGSSSATAATCDKVASPLGFNFNPGTVVAPYRTPGKLARSLSAGQTGCFRAGTYHFAPRSGGGESLKVTRSGITLRSYPGERARLVGRLWIARDAASVRITDLDLDGSTSPPCPGRGSSPCLASPTVNATRTTFRNVNVTNRHRAICFELGVPGYGRARHTLIANSRIHDCGRLPATNRDHGIYVDQSDDAVIRDNLIYDNADRAIQLYPDAQGTRILANVIDGNGTGIRISGGSGHASSDLVARYNVITNSTHYGVDSWYPQGNPIGTDNLVTHNCVWGAFGHDLGAIGREEGFNARANIAADPEYVDRARGDFRLEPASPCLELGKVALRLSRASVHRGGSVGARGWASATSPIARLAAGTSSPSASRTALIQRHGATRWRTIAELPIGSDGSFRGQVEISPRRAIHRLELRARVPEIGRSEPVWIRVTD